MLGKATSLNGMWSKVVQQVTIECRKTVNKVVTVDCKRSLLKTSQLHATEQEALDSEVFFLTNVSVNTVNNYLAVFMYPKVTECSLF